MTNLETIQKYKKIHMIGIGGVSMSGLAEHLTHYGFIITGSDAHESDNTKHLKKLGINVQIGHHPEMIADADLIVYTAAIQENDLERQKALELKKEHMERSEFLGLITKCYKECICISGTHGKTTTTSMIATCFLEAEYDPTIEVGAYLKNIKGNNKTGNSDYFILEACEYVDSFLHFYPKTEIILNIDNDHLDYFKTIDNIKHSFQKFIQRLDNNGLVIANYDDENTVEVTKDMQSSLITYAIDHKADYQARNIILDSYGYPTFECFKNDNYFFTFTLSVRGFHNILNALACIATCDYYQIDSKTIQKGLQNFTGANRRFEKIGEYQSIPVFDDYAHHPTEIKTTLNTSKEIPHHETWAIFEPHTYTRTEEHLKEFAKILAEFDHIILSEIYAARETNTTGISSKDLLKLIQEKNPNSIYLDSYDKIILYLKEHVKKDDIIVTIGAGPINQVGYQLIQK